MSEQAAQRRNPHVLRVGQDSVVVPARIAALIEAQTNISKLRVGVRGVDQEATAVLEAIRVVAMSWPPESRFLETETEGDKNRKPAPESMSTGQVATRLGLTPQAVGKAIRAGRLRAQQDESGRYRISHQDYEHFKAARSA